MEYENPPLLTPAGGRVIMRDDESDGNNGMPTSEQQLSAAVTTGTTWSATADCHNELTASIAAAATSSSLPAEKSSPSSSSLLTISPTSKLSITTASPSKKRNKRMSYEWIVAAMIVLLCSSSFHQSSVLAASVTDSLTEMDTVGLAGNSADAAMRMRGATNGIQRKRGVQRITNHRRLDHHRQQLQQQQQRTLQDMCTCSPQIFNVKVTLTPTNPCTTDDLKPNLGIENTLCLYNAPPAPPTTAAPTPAPVDSSSTTEPTESGTNDPFKPPPPPPQPEDGPGNPTYFPTYSPTKSEEGGRVSSEVLPGGNGSNPRDGSGARGREEEPTFQPTHAWPTFSPTDVPTQEDVEQGGSGGGGGRPRGGGRGGWLDEDEEGMPQTLSSSVNLDDDELIEPHHHRHHHHHTPLANENGGGRKLLESNSGRLKRVINVDELVLVQQDDTNEDDSSSSSSDADKDGNKEIMPPYYQPPAVVSPSTLNRWISIHPNDVFFEKHPELKFHQEEIYRMKHGLSSSSSQVAASASSMTRSLQSSSGFMPTELISAQFLEMDTSPNMQIINNDDQYINVTFPDPSNIVLQFSSISNLLKPDLPLSEQMEYVPGGAILILVGTTADGEVVRNRMMWTYTMGCGLEDYTVLDGNVIGWAGFVSMIIDFTFLSLCLGLVVDGLSHTIIHNSFSIVQ